MKVGWGLVGGLQSLGDKIGKESICLLTLYLTFLKGIKCIDFDEISSVKVNGTWEKIDVADFSFSLFYVKQFDGCYM